MHDPSSSTEDSQLPAVTASPPGRFWLNVDGIIAHFPLLLLPYVFGLGVVLIALNVVFFVDLYNVLLGLAKGSPYLKIMDLVEYFMVSTVVCQTAMGNYNTYIRPLYLGDEPSPRLVKKFTSVGLKVNMYQALAAVSGISLLGEFLANSGHWDTLLQRVVIHQVLLVSALLSWYIESPRKPAQAKENLEKLPN
jgi:uncharacterized protein (TIGR00645 family)